MVLNKSQREGNRKLQPTVLCGRACFCDVDLKDALNLPFVSDASVQLRRDRDPLGGFTCTDSNEVSPATTLDQQCAADVFLLPPLAK